jgi:hypothetical protein
MSPDVRPSLCTCCFRGNEVRFELLTKTRLDAEVNDI